MPKLFHRCPRHPASRGQAVVEFALVVPILLMMVVAIADFGRYYASAVAIESAAREAADYGAFSSNHWSPANVTTTVAEMQRRSCVAAAGSHLADYESSDPLNATCTNPAFTCTLEHGVDSVACDASGGMVGAVDCSDPTTLPACTVDVTLDFQFDTFLGIPPLPDSFTITRDSRFRVSDLAPP